MKEKEKARKGWLQMFKETQGRAWWNPQIWKVLYFKYITPTQQSTSVEHHSQLQPLSMRCCPISPAPRMDQHSKAELCRAKISPGLITMLCSVCPGRAAWSFDRGNLGPVLESSWTFQKNWLLFQKVLGWHPRKTLSPRTPCLAIALLHPSTPGNPGCSFRL